MPYTEPSQRFPDLENREYDTISDYMLTPGLSQPCESDNAYLATDYSFTGQIEAATDADVMLFTASSAIPVADAVRGYLETTGKTAPQLGYIRADFEAQAAYNYENDRTRLNGETNRLTPLLKEAETVSVVDEFICSGATLNFAKTILQNCGITAVTPLAGRWYMQAYKSEVNSENLTSRHADFMRSIGRQAALQTVSEIRA